MLSIATFLTVSELILVHMHVPTSECCMYINVYTTNNAYHHIYHSHLSIWCVCR